MGDFLLEKMIKSLFVQINPFRFTNFDPIFDALGSSDQFFLGIFSLGISFIVSVMFDL